jgi:hypothetical protein
MNASLPMVGFSLAEISLGDTENHPPEIFSIKRLPECQRRKIGFEWPPIEQRAVLFSERVVKKGYYDLNLILLKF